MIENSTFLIRETKHQDQEDNPSEVAYCPVDREAADYLDGFREGGKVDKFQTLKKVAQPIARHIPSS